MQRPVVILTLNKEIRETRARSARRSSHNITRNAVVGNLLQTATYRHCTRVPWHRSRVNNRQTIFGKHGANVAESNVNSKNRVREVQWQQRTEDLAILWHELHLTLQLGMRKRSRGKTSQKERERERKRFAGGRDETRGFDRWGPDLRVATGTFARCFLPLGFQGCFWIACGARAGWPGLSYWLLLPTSGRSTDRNWCHSKRP